MEVLNDPANLAGINDLLDKNKQKQATFVEMDKQVSYEMP